MALGETRAANRKNKEGLCIQVGTREKTLVSPGWGRRRWFLQVRDGRAKTLSPGRTKTLAPSS